MNDFLVAHKSDQLAGAPSLTSSNLEGLPPVNCGPGLILVIAPY
jgi:hypothetical protein